MTVIEHLGELRRRLMISIVAVVVAGDRRLHLRPRDHQLADPVLQRRRPQGDAEQVHLHRAARRVRHPPEDRDLRRHRARAAGLAVGAVALHHPGPQPEREEVRDPVRRSRRSCCSCWAASSRCSRSSPPSSSCSSIGGSDLQPLLTADKYISLVSLMILAFGLVVRVPGRAGVPADRPRASRPRSCGSWRRWADR